MRLSNTPTLDMRRPSAENPGNKIDAAGHPRGPVNSRRRPSRRTRPVFSASRLWDDAATTSSPDGTTTSDGRSIASPTTTSSPLGSSGPITPETVIFRRCSTSKLNALLQLPQNLGSPYLLVPDLDKPNYGRPMKVANRAPSNGPAGHHFRRSAECTPYATSTTRPQTAGR